MVDRERPDDVDAVAERERPPDDLLRELVGDDRRAGDEQRGRSTAHVPAPSERSADETGWSAFAVEPMRTSTGGRSVRAGSLIAALQRALVVDAERRVRHGLEPLLADRAAADRAASVRAVVDPAERGLDLDEEVLGVLLEPLVELAHVRLRRAVGDVVAGADREIARLLEQRAVVVHGLARVPQAVALALEHGRGSDRGRRSCAPAAAASRASAASLVSPSSATTLSRDARPA